ncbi:hypothetical protein [Nocardia testacea]|uniref:hypothetical protein n=1 Tax=Nocardia testacea TaxID=248551 RepID=UPI00340E126F
MQKRALVVDGMRSVFSGIDDPVVRHVLDSLEEASAEALRSVLLGLVRRIRGRRPATEAGGPRIRALSGTSR